MLELVACSCTYLYSRTEPTCQKATSTADTVAPATCIRMAGPACQAAPGPENRTLHAGEVPHVDRAALSPKIFVTFAQDQRARSFSAAPPPTGRRAKAKRFFLFVHVAAS